MSDHSDKKYASPGEVSRMYWQHVKRYPFLLIFSFVGAMGIQAAALSAPWFLRQFFNTLAGNQPTAPIVGHLVGLVGILAFIYIAEWVLRRVMDLGVMRLESSVMTDLFSSTFEYLIGHSYNFFISRFAGSLTHRVSKFVRAFEVIFDAILLQFFPTFLFVVGAITVLFIRNHTLGIMLGTWAVLFISFQLYVARLRQPVRAERSEADTQVTGTLADSISNHSTIVLFSGERHERGLFAEVVARWRAATLRSWSFDNVIWSGVGAFMLSIEIALLYGATVFWSRGLLTVGDFVLIQAYLLTTFDRLISINRELRRFFDAFADASEMAYILELPHEIEDAPDAPVLEVFGGEITFSDVQFAFHAGKPVLNNLNLQIAGRERIALVGPSGAGKSTVTKLLLRFYDIDKGSIMIDGQDIAEVQQASLRNAIAFVPQEPILFHRSLMENIRYGRRDASDEEVIAAAKKAHCHEFIVGLPEQYDTYVGERGVKLSGGERQRVAIARAILKNAPILVLDEATSSLDSESEAYIQDALEVLMKGKTVVVIAHRLSTIMKMDRIVVVEGGRVASEGTHQELLHGGGLYQKLWSIQAGGFLPVPPRGALDIVEEPDEDEEEDKEPPQGAIQK